MDTDRLSRKALNNVGLTRSSAPANENGPCQLLQLQHTGTGEVHDSIPSVQIYGFASSPMPGCDHVTIYAEGDRSKGITIGSNDQRLRPKGMISGESQIHDASGQFLYLQAGSKIVVNAVSEIDVQINGSLVLKVTSTGIAVTGSITATGDITGGFGGGDAVEMQHHTHTYIPGSGSATQTSGPVAGT
jgi:phage gp45-like